MASSPKLSGQHSERYIGLQRPTVVFGLSTVMCSLFLFGSIGCGKLLYRFTEPAPPLFVPNPLDLPPGKDQFIWSQVVDTVDDYFRVAREQPVQNSGGLVLEGRLETSYQIGASILEPWRKDSTSGFERLQSTFQSIRRRAMITLRPSETGYVLEVVVQKELEDTDRRQLANETTSSQRHDGTVVRRGGEGQTGPRTLGWIPLGRDSTLEQRLLHEIHRRVTEPDS